MVRVEQLRKAYGATVAVDGISFEIRPRETFGLLGPNGAGKTTTLHLLVGLLRPDAGEVHIDGRGDPTRAKVRRNLGIAPQALSLYEDFTAAENLRFFGRLYGLRGGALSERVAELLEQASLANRQGHRVRTFSGGMKRRLQLACALVHDPQVLLLDEPTIGIDPHARQQIHQDIETLRERGRTILLTTHYIEEAERLCDRVAVMDRGRLLAMDTVENMLARYGGRSVVEAELESAPPPGVAIPGRVDGSSVTIETDRPFEAVRELAASGLTIRSLAVHRPNLETVFLKLTGRKLEE